MNEEFKLNFGGHRYLADRWMKRKKGYDTLWKIITILIILFAFWTGWNTYSTFCLNAINPDTVPMMTLFSVFLTLLFLPLAAFPYKLWRALLGGQLYYMRGAGVTLGDEELKFYYHPYKDRYFPTSYAVNSIPYNKIHRITVNRTTRLVTIEGTPEFELTRFSFGLATPVPNAQKKYAKWSCMQFFLAFEEGQEETFLKKLEEKQVKIQYMTEVNGKALS